MFNEESPHARFTLGVRGYDTAEVDAYLKGLEAESSSSSAELRRAREEAAASADELVAARQDVKELERLLAESFDGSGTGEAQPPLEGMGKCIEVILRTSADMAEQLRREAQALAEEELTAARAESKRLYDAAADDVAKAAELRSEAERERAEAAVELRDAIEEADHAGKRAEAARQDLKTAVAERDRVIEQLRSITTRVDHWLEPLTGAASDSGVAAQVETDGT